MKNIEIGSRFGRLTVLSETDKSKNGQRLYLCQCDCGKQKEIRIYDIRRQVSCGCSRKKTNIKNLNPLYRLWISIKSRCYCVTSTGYMRYGGSGISMCDEWKYNFEAFEEWAIATGYVYKNTELKNKITIDRIDPYGNYEPENCRWLSFSENQRANKRKRGTVAV